MVVVNGERTLALLCPACQQIHEHTFSIFSAAQKALPLFCDCGFSQGSLRRHRKNFELDVFSSAGDRVRLLLSLREFLAVPLIALFAPQNGQEIGFFGDGPAVSEAVETELKGRTLAHPAGVNNPEIMHEILKTLQELAERHKIRCRCEQPSVGIDVYADRVELVCAFCGSAVLIGASTREERDQLSRVSEIIMEPSTYVFLEEWLKPIT